MMADARRTGRRPGVTHTRDDILEAARRLFSRNGYSGTSIRAIAREAGVDPALVHHYFRSKAEVFAAAVDDALRPSEILGEDDLEPDTLGESLVRRFLERIESPAAGDSLLAVLRSAVTHDEVAKRLRGFLANELYARVAQAIRRPDSALRAALVGSALVGIAISRLVLKVEALARVDRETLVRAVGPTVQRYLTGDIGTRAT